MKIIDTHCDLLYQMFRNPKVQFEQGDGEADVSYSRLKKAGVVLQWFAIYLPDDPRYYSFEHVLACIDLFRTRIAACPQVHVVRNREDLSTSLAEGKLGVMLTLEGVEGLAANISHLRTAYDLGVRSIGITWNHANWAADGVGEPRLGGFTLRGKAFVQECDRLGIVLDVSHLSEKGFWELCELSPRPFIASHSNAYQICAHRRNLKDDQIRAIIQKKGRIGITFVPAFVRPEEPQIKDLLLHIDHICSLGGEERIGFGSDFDGMDDKIPGLEHPAHYSRLADELHKRYTNEQAERFLFGNWNSYLLQNLPEA
ncbi:dipeptidase [Paenibacillus sp. J2TS4]|uniref:dipeptidase n=1 Tax=Paenibacillus sp. J2TS4 TaxID=2807194 RepID=UPI001B239266|nr:dipeptidase [Paenibacillus sp. J2TS4]GIP33149.1 diguanylate cyclase [Paenibacillus sp. J2TS4]